MTPAQEQIEQYAAAVRNLGDQLDTLRGDVQRLHVTATDALQSQAALLAEMETDLEPIGTVEDLPLYTVLSNGYALILNAPSGPCAIALSHERSSIENLDANGVPYYSTVDDTLTPALQELL